MRDMAHAAGAVVWAMRIWPIIAGLVLAGSIQPSQAQNTLSVGGATVVPGQQAVVLEINATTTSPLTFLDADVVFDGVLCGRIEMQTTTSPPEDRNPIALLDGVRCPGEGRVSFIALDFSGTLSIPPGAGPIGRWTFNVRSDAVGGSFPLMLRVNDARNGTLPVQVAIGEQGTLVIDAPIPTDTPTVPVPDTPTPEAATPTPSRTNTGAFTPTVATPTAMATDTDTPTPVSPSPTAVDTPGRACAGDCNGDGTVAINELIVGVNIALGSAPVSACPEFDANGDGQVSISELIRGVNNALNGCSA